MGKPIRMDDLETAVRNVRKIQTFFAAASAGETDGTVESGLRRVADVLERMSGDARSIAVTLPDQDLEVASDPDSVATVRLDPAKVEGIAGYLETVARWLAARVDVEPPAEAAALLLELVARLERTTARVRTLLDISSSHPQSIPAPQAEAPPSPEELARREAQAARCEALEPLVLDNTFENPLLRGKEGHYELTTAARKLVEEWVGSAGLETSTGSLYTLHRKIARWIEGIPEGMVLVLKVGMLSGRPEVYPRYVPRSDDDS